MLTVADEQIRQRVHKVAEEEIKRPRDEITARQDTRVVQHVYIEDAGV